MKNYLILALDLEEKPWLGCPECHSRGEYCIPGARITKIGHEPNCSIAPEIRQWIRTNREIVEKIVTRTKNPYECVRNN